jgi:CheY-like chemotaxis protein
MIHGNATQAMSDSKTIHLADDDEDDRLLMKEAMEEVDPTVNVVEAENGAELLKNLKDDHSQADSVIILDMNMPVMNGLETMSAIKADPETEKIPTVMMSTSSNPVLKKKAFDAGVDEFITKPSTFRALISVVNKIIRRFLS